MVLLFPRGGVVPSFLSTRFLQFLLHASSNLFYPLSSHHRFSPTHHSTQQHHQHKCVDDMVTVGEARRLLRLVNIEAVKKRLESDRRECMSYADLLHLSQTMGVASSNKEAEDFARALDDACVVFIFRDKVYLCPQLVAELVSKAVPLCLTSGDDPCHLELEQMRNQKKEIDRIAHRQVRTRLWIFFCFQALKTTFFVRLTFWELSWDVMEPIAFFMASGDLIIGYTYFLLTSRDPTYQDFMTRLFLSKQRKLMERRNFNIQRFHELEQLCQANPKIFHSSKGS